MVFTKSKQTAKSKQVVERAAASRAPQTDEEEAFPRGGSTGLTARERREVHEAAEKAVELELAAQAQNKVRCHMATLGRSKGTPCTSRLSLGVAGREPRGD